MKYRKVLPALLAIVLVVALALVGCQKATTTTKAGIKSPADLKGKKVGVQVDTTGQLEAEKILGKNYPNLKKYDDILTAFADLNAGRIDAIVNDKPVSAYVIKKTYPTTLELVTTITTNEGYGIWFKKDNPGIQAAVNQALKEIEADGTYNKIYVKWFGTVPEKKSGTAPEEKPGKVAAAKMKFTTLKPGVLSFGADTAFPPFEFKEGANYVGFDVDLGKEVCKRLGVKYEIVSTAWDGIIANLKASKYDAIMSAMTVTADRQKEMLATDEYIISNQSIAAKKQ